MKTVKKFVSILCLLSLLCSVLSTAVLATTSSTGYEEGDGWINENPNAPTDYAYSIAVVGDTQTVVKKDLANGTTYLSSIYDWILANKDTKNIQYVFGLGDITENDTDEEWVYAKSHISKLNGSLPYILNRGNDPHDSVKQMNAYYASDADYTAMLDGVMTEGSVVNAYSVFTAGSTKYLVLAIDFAPSDAEIEWAESVIVANPDCKVIITTHAYLYSDGEPQTYTEGSVANKTGADDGVANNGDQIWEKLVRKHQNITMVLSGHNPSSNIIWNQSEGDNGNVVTSLLVDSQSFDAGKNGETGMVCMLYFSEDGRTVDVEWISTVREQFYKEENQFSLNLAVAATDVVTKYGVIPAQYADPIEWPFVVFSKTATTVDGVEYDYTFNAANKVLMKNETLGLTANADFAYHKARYAGDGAVILMRRDYVDTSTGSYTNIAFNPSTVYFDLGGFTLTDKHTHNATLFYSYEKNSTAGTTFTVMNGTILVGDKGLTNYTTDTKYSGKKPINFVFDGVRIAFLEGSQVSNLFGRYTGDETELFTLTVKNSVIDLANARSGINLLTTGTLKGAIDFTFENTEIINSPALTTQYSATMADGFLLHVYVKTATSNSNITIDSITFDGVEYALGDCTVTQIGTINYYVFTKAITPECAADGVTLSVNINHKYKFSDGTYQDDKISHTQNVSVVDYLESVVRTKSGTVNAMAKAALSYIKAAYIYADGEAETLAAVTERIDTLLGATYDEKNAPTVPEAKQETDGLSSAQLMLGSSPYFVFCPEVDESGNCVYNLDDYVFALNGKYLLEHEVVEEDGVIKLIVKSYAFAMDDDIEYIVKGTNVSGVFNIGAYHEFAGTTGDAKLVALVERLIKLAESAEAYRNAQM